jgi:hypothetical protein
LEPAEAVIWNAIVIRLPADFFTSETVPLLKAYCRHAGFADRFAREIVALRAAIDALDTSKPRGQTRARKLEERLHGLHKMHGYETDHAMACATRLRLTNQSRFVPEKAASKARSALANGPPPWHDWDTQTGDSEN